MIRRVLFTTRKRVLGGLAFLLALGGGLPGLHRAGPRGGLVSRAVAGEPAPEDSSGPASFRGTRDSRRFWITDFRYGLPVDTLPQTAEGRAVLGLGQMWRAGRNNAVGGAVTLSVGTTTRWGLELRYRRWVGREIHLEAATGAWSGGTAFENGGEYALTGALLRGEAGFGDSIGLWLQADHGNVASSRTETSWTAGVTFGSYAGASAGVIGAALVVAYVVALAGAGG